MRAILVGLITAACALGAHLETIQYASRAFGKTYVVTITQESLNRAPKWEEAADNPPLSARDAIELATQLKDTLVKDDDDYTWKLERASLVPTQSGNDQWYWLVDYVARFRGASTGQPNQLRLAVLMDGTVVKPTVKEER